MFETTGAVNTEEPIIEQEMADAYAQLDALVDATAQPGVLSQYGIWLIIGAIVAVVVIMFLMIAGRHRQDRDHLSDEPAEPLFDSDGLGTLAGQDLSAGFTDMTNEPEEGDYYGEEEVEEESLRGGFDAEIVASDETPEEQDTSENVVPLRGTADAEEAATDTAEPAEEDEQAPEEYKKRRFAFGGGRTEVTDNSTFQRSGEESGTSAFRNRMGGQAATPPTDTYGMTAQSGDVDDQGRPFVAPFIREDIDRAEKRQSERLDMLRDDISRQVQAMKSEQSSRLDLVISAIDRKLEGLDRKQTGGARVVGGSDEMSSSVTSLGSQVERLSSAIDGQGQRIRAITTILENRFAEVVNVHNEVKTVHEAVKSVRSDLGLTGESIGSIKSELDEMKEHVGRLERAMLDRAGQDSAKHARLQDVIRGTLPDGAYQFGATLANGEMVDCLVNFDGLRDKVAIDGNFPMEAFHELPSQDAVRRNLPQAKVAEDAFRRAILRSILETADRCISHTETTDSCLLFMPSEAAYTILHDRFPDLVRDSQRARVWLVSPSTLMGTLNLIRNLLPDVEALSQATETSESRRAEEQRLRDEVEVLRRRASSLSDELDRTRGTLRGLIGNGSDTSYRDEPARPAESEADRKDDEAVRYEGTPEWTAPVREQTSSLFDEDRNDTLR